jgi:hypothetical protein
VLHGPLGRANCRDPQALQQRAHFFVLHLHPPDGAGERAAMKRRRILARIELPDHGKENALLLHHVAEEFL